MTRDEVECISGEPFERPHAHGISRLEEPRRGGSNESSHVDAWYVVGQLAGESFGIGAEGVDLGCQPLLGILGVFGSRVGDCLFTSFFRDPGLAITSCLDARCAGCLSLWVISPDTSIDTGNVLRFTALKIRFELCEGLVAD